MSATADMTERHTRVLMGLAELALDFAQDLRAVLQGLTHPADVARVANAFSKVSRCVRLTIALEARLARGDVRAPALDAPRPDPGPRIEAEPALEREERPEALEQEDLYERLPDGPPAQQVALLADTFVRIVSELRRPHGGRIVPLPRNYEALCRELTANDPDPPDRPPRVAAAPA